MIKEMEDSQELTISTKLLATMYHEIRTAMNDIGGLAVIAKAKLSDQKQAEEYLNRIQEEVQNFTNHMEHYSEEIGINQALKVSTDNIWGDVKEVAEKLNAPIEDAADRCEGKRVLLVEDNCLSSDVEKELIAFAGAQIECAKSGLEALQILEHSEEGYFDLVFMDIQMPDMDGYETTRRIRKSGRKDVASIPVIALTANAFAEDIQMAIEAGMNEHAAKPLDVVRIQSLIINWT